MKKIESNRQVSRIKKRDKIYNKWKNINKTKGGNKRYQRAKSNIEAKKTDSKAKKTNDLFLANLINWKFVM